jgi:hypothetical protein
MVEIVNLRQVRKRKARGAREHAAEENRVRFGRSKADVKLERAQRAIDEARLDGHSLDAHRQDPHGRDPHGREEDHDD